MWPAQYWVDMTVPNMSSNQIGRRGEVLVESEFLRPVYHGWNRPLFRAIHLGDKYPIVDYIVDLLDARERTTGFFYVQVKATDRDASGRRRLPVRCDKLKYNALISLPIPTYLVGVNLFDDTLFVRAACRSRTQRLTSMTKSHSLATDSVKVTLYKEVRSYWKTHRIRMWKSALKDD